jgi:anti-sigma-K factor RskA
VSESHEPYDTLAALHAVGALDGEDLRDFEAHLRGGCARCEAVVRQTEQALARAAMAGPPETPPGAIRETLMRRAARAAPPGRRRWLPWAVGLAAVAIGAAALSAAYVAARYEARLGQMARETSAAKERVARSEAELRAELEAHRAAIELLRDPTARIVELRGQGPASEAAARLLVTDRSGALLLVAKLPPPPADRVYALWVVEGETPRSAGVFLPDAGGRAMVRVPPRAAAPSVRAATVTLEPASGAATPSGNVVLASTAIPGGR